MFCQIFTFQSLEGFLPSKERRNKDEEYENQLKILAKRVGEVGTENHDLNMNLKEYQTAYYQLKTENEELKKKLEEPKKAIRKKKETEE